MRRLPAFNSKLTNANSSLYLGMRFIEFLRYLQNRLIEAQARFHAKRPSDQARSASPDGLLSAVFFDTSFTYSFGPKNPRAAAPRTAMIFRSDAMSKPEMTSSSESVEERSKLLSIHTEPSTRGARGNRRESAAAA